MKTEVVILGIINLAALFWVGYWAFMANRKVEWIKTELKKEELAHNVRFTNAFETYKSLWRIVSRFALSAKHYFAFDWKHDEMPEDEHPISHIKDYLAVLKKQRPLIEIRYEIEDILFYNSPFIACSVKEKTSSRLNLCGKEAIEILYDIREGMAYSPYNFERYENEVDRRLVEIQAAIEEQTGQ
jgi:hypothetical protein